MRLQFVYKNNGAIYQIAEGMSLIRNYNETLDSATVVISHLDSEIDIEPFDEVILKDFNEDIYMCVNEYTCQEIRNRTGDKYYKYEIKLFSQTKLLENVVLPSLSITPLKDLSQIRYVAHFYELPRTVSEGDVFNYIGNFDTKVATPYTLSCDITSGITTDITSYFNIEFTYTNFGYNLKLTANRNFTIDTFATITAVGDITYIKMAIYDYLVRYNDLYGQKVRTNNGFVNKFSFSGDCATKFADDCPELQFNAPTFRECLTQLMMVKDCIPIVKNNVISFIDLSSRKNEITNAPISYIQKSQSSEDYVSDLKMNIKNTIQDNTFVECVEYMGVRNNDGALVNDKKMFLYTQHPIYDIEKVDLICMMTFKDRLSGRDLYVYFDEDITKLVVEKGKWDVLEIRATLNESDYANFYKYQNTTLYYTRGNNIIRNIEASTSLDFPIADWTTIQWIGKGLLRKWMEEKQFTDFPVGNIWEANNRKWWEGIAFRIKYKTKADITAKIGKRDNKTTKRELVDNQSNNYVNAFTQGLLEYAKANRLGNVMKVINSRYTLPISSEYQLIKEGDYINDSDIIYQVEYTIYKNYVSVIANACPNYVLRNYFTGVQSKLRSWKIVDTNEAFNREEIYKLYFEFDYAPHIEKLDEFIDHNNGFLNMCLGPLTDNKFDIKSINSCTTGINWFVNENIKNVVGNSVIYTFGYEDNFQISRWIQEIVEGGTKQQIYSYAGDNGYYRNMEISFVKDYVVDSNLPESGGYYPETATPTFFVDFMNKIDRMPLRQYESYTLFFYVSLLHHKDNKEIIKQNIQFEYCGNSEDIVITDDFMLSHINKVNKSDLAIRVSSVEPNIFNKHKVLEIVGESNISINNLTTTEHPNEHYVEINISNVAATDYVYIYNTITNKTLLAFKGNKLYMNILKDRRKEIYTKNGDNWSVSGNI